ncbi:MAG TPA: hypothetical protein VFH25_08645 [Nitrososphaeraceae archaeon]|nr:hypothetical protein [Nitrososphaeraceae archaeon]
MISKPSICYREDKWMDKVLKAVLKRQIPFIIGGTITGIIVTYYYGFLFSIIVNSAIWMFISFIVNKFTGSQQDLKMRNILCTMPYQSLILGQKSLEYFN